MFESFECRKKDSRTEHTVARVFELDPNQRLLCVSLYYFAHFFRLLLLLLLNEIIHLATRTI